VPFCVKLRKKNSNIHHKMSLSQVFTKWPAWLRWKRLEWCPSTSLVQRIWFQQFAE